MAYSTIPSAARSRTSALGGDLAVSSGQLAAAPTGNFGQVSPFTTNPYMVVNYGKDKNDPSYANTQNLDPTQAYRLVDQRTGQVYTSDPNDPGSLARLVLQANQMSGYSPTRASWDLTDGSGNAVATDRPNRSLLNKALPYLAIALGALGTGGALGLLGGAAGGAGAAGGIGGLAAGIGSTAGSIGAGLGGLGAAAAGAGTIGGLAAGIGSTAGSVGAGLGGLGAAAGGLGGAGAIASGLGGAGSIPAGLTGAAGSVGGGIGAGLGTSGLASGIGSAAAGSVGGIGGIASGIGGTAGSIAGALTPEIVVTGAAGAGAGAAGAGLGGALPGIGGLASGLGAVGAGIGGGTQQLSPEQSWQDRVSRYLELAGYGTGLIGNLFGGGGGSGSGGAIPNAQMDPLFSAQLPSANLPGGNNLAPRTMPQQNWANYAFGPEQSFFNNVPQPPGYARGGDVHPAGGGLSHVSGEGSGRSDDIQALLSDGEYVMDAETVALLGDGSNKAGADALDKLRVNLRKHKGRSLAKGHFSRNAKRPEQYLSGGPK